MIGFSTSTGDPRPAEGATASVAALAKTAAILLAVGLVLVVWPDLDTAAARVFYKGGGAFAGADQPVVEAVRKLFYLGFCAFLVLALVAVAIAARTQGPWLGWGMAQWAIVALCLVTGPGLVANIWFKEHWGRARPRAIVEFGGDKAFTRALVPADNCERNCSFVAGEASTGFMPLYALAAVTPQVAVPLVIGGTAIGLAAGVVRMAQGGHFLSDVVFAGAFMALTAILMRWLVFGWGAERPQGASSPRPGGRAERETST